jgi:hypothetical protein
MRMSSLSRISTVETRASPLTPTSANLSGPTARVLSLALRATDRGSRTNTAQRAPPAPLQSHFAAPAPPALSNGSVALDPLMLAE